MKLIVGLGNPGIEYKATRHNAGFMAVQELATFYGAAEFKKADKFKALTSECLIEGEKVILAMPQTFMNLSGQSLVPLMNYHKIPLEDVIVIYDDADLPYGSLRIRIDGSAGGHNGIKSIIKETGTQRFTRIRLGIKPPESFKGPLENYVLGRFSQEEESDFLPVIESLPKVISLIFEEGALKAMNEFN